MAKEEEEIEKKEIEQEPKKTGQEVPKEIKQEGKEKKNKGAPKEGKKASSKSDETEDEIKHIVRIADTDLAGKRSVQYALTGIKGINRRIAKIMAVESGLDPMATLGYLKDEEIERLQNSVDSISTIIPSWLMNKQHDFISGEDRHVIGIDVDLSINEDLNFMKKTRSYKGIRHERGLRVRGQRTRSTGRKGRTVGVTRSSLAGGKSKKEESK